MKVGDRVLLRPCHGYSFHRWADVVKISPKGLSAEFLCTNGDRVILSGSALHNGIEPDAKVGAEKDARHREVVESFNCANRACDGIGPLFDLVRSLSSTWRKPGKPIPAELRKRLDAHNKVAKALTEALKPYA